MSSSLSKLVKYLSEKLHSDKCTNCKSHLDYMSIKDDQRGCTQLIFKYYELKKVMTKTLTKN